MRRPFLDRPVALLGQSLPMACVVLVVFVVLGSAILSFLQRQGLPALTLAMLSPALVLGGHVWRLLTWGLFEADGQNLVFGAFLLGMFGRDLGGLWGGKRYLVTCALAVLGTGVLTTVIGFLWGDVYGGRYLSIWPLTNALIVAWSLLFPNRTILFMLVLPASGRNLLYLTVGVTALFAIMYGFAYFLPHFVAMGLMYAYLRGGPLVRAQLKLNKLLSSKRSNPGFRVVEGGGNKNPGKGPNDSGWVH